MYLNHSKLTFTFLPNKISMNKKNILCAHSWWWQQQCYRSCWLDCFLLLLLLKKKYNLDDPYFSFLKYLNWLVSTHTNTEIHFFKLKLTTIKYMDTVVCQLNCIIILCPLMKEKLASWGLLLWEMYGGHMSVLSSVFRESEPRWSHI